MKADLEKLARANPVTVEEGETWARTVAAESARLRALEGELEVIDELTNRRSPPLRWPAAVVSGALVLLLAVPALLFLGDEVQQTTTTTMPASTSVTESSVPVVEDPFYTAVLGCVADQTGNDFGPVTVDKDGSLTARGRSALDGAASGYPGPYQACFEEVTGLSGSLVNQSFALSEGEASIPVPNTWLSTVDDLTPNVGDPDERISISTYLLTEGGDGCAQVPAGALDDLTSNDVFVQILERSGNASASPRPATFAGRLTGVEEGSDFWECVTPEERSDFGTLLFLDFGHEGRQFYVLLAIGSETGDDELHTVELMLDRIVIRPEIAPGWTFTEIPFTIREGSAYALGGDWMFVWGGASDGQGEMPRDGIMVSVDTGEGRLMPDAPIEGRYLPSAVWTGTELIVFGGHSSIESLVDGAAYNPETGNWRLIHPAPLRPAANPAGVWTGDEMMVWLAGEDSIPTDLPQPTKGQLASYNPTTDSWTILNHPDLEIMDATLLLYGGNLMLIGGPNMRDVGVFGSSPSLSATVLDLSSQVWSQPVIDGSGESARAFTLGDSVAVLRDDGEIHLLRENGWEYIANFSDSCGFDLAASSGGGTAYLKCGSNYLLVGNDIVPILGAEDYGATSNTYGSAFLATDDGRLVVMGDAKSFYPVSGIVVFGVYEPAE